MLTTKSRSSCTSEETTFLNKGKRATVTTKEMAVASDIGTAAASCGEFEVTITVRRPRRRFFLSPGSLRRRNLSSAVGTEAAAAVDAVVVGGEAKERLATGDDDVSEEDSYDGSFIESDSDDDSERGYFRDLQGDGKKPKVAAGSSLPVSTICVKQGKPKRKPPLTLLVECDFCGTTLPLSATRKTYIQCGLCAVTNYCSIKCRQSHRKGAHTLAQCKAVNNINQILCHRLSVVIEGLLPHNVQHLMTQLAYGCCSLLPSSSVNFAEERVVNKLRICYVGSMTYTGHTELLAWTKDAVLGMHQWLEDAARVAQVKHSKASDSPQETKGLLRNDVSYSPERLLTISPAEAIRARAGAGAATLLDCKDFPREADDERKTTLPSSVRLLDHSKPNDGFGPRAVRRIVKSDNTGLVIVVESPPGSAVLHLHMLPLIDRDREMMSKYGWEMLVVASAERGTWPGEHAPPRCLRFGEFCTFGGSNMPQREINQWMLHERSLGLHRAAVLPPAAAAAAVATASQHKKGTATSAAASAASAAATSDITLQLKRRLMTLMAQRKEPHTSQPHHHDAKCKCGRNL